MKTKTEVQAGSADWRISLCKLLGQNISDVDGYYTVEFGNPPTFQIAGIVLESGVRLQVEGEHDIAYISQALPGVSDEQAELLYAEFNLE